MKPLCNLHTHTHFCDGKDSPEDIVRAAIAEGAETIGFSGHISVESAADDSEWCMVDGRFEAYCDEIEKLKVKYQDKLTILLGAELDYFSSKQEKKFDYTIGSVHYVKKNGVLLPVDLSGDELLAAANNYYFGNMMAFVFDYYELCSSVYDVTECDIVGHFDLLTKYNEKCHYIDENNSKYRSLAIDALDNLLKKDLFFEVNTGAISRGYRTTPYPAPFIVKRIIEKNGKLILNSDSHSKETLFDHFEDTVEYLKTLGVKELWVYKNNGFAPIKI